MGLKGLVFLAGLAAGGCAIAPRPRAIPPDSAAIAAAGPARSEFERRRRIVADEDLATRVSEIGRRAVEAALPTAGLTGDWRFAVLDAPEPGAFLFADRRVFVSRGALAALPGEPALEELFRGAAAMFAGGRFRSPGDGALVEQPVRVPLPEAGASPGPGRDRWLDLLDGLVFGEPPEFGVADGSRLLLPAADFRLFLPDGVAFESTDRGVFAAGRSGEATGLMVRQLPPPEGIRPPDGDLAAERALIDDLGERLNARAARDGREAALVEAFRVRGFTGVRARLRAAADPGADPPSGLIALFLAPGALVEASLECLRRPFRICEAEFLEVLGGADRLWDTPVPGPLRLRALPVPEAGPTRRVLGRLAAAGRSDVSARVLFELNRGWLDEELSPADRVLIVSRDRPPVEESER